MSSFNTAAKVMFAAVAATFLSSAAHAADARSITVTAADLNLASDAGRERLTERVRGAVNEVCLVSDWGAGIDAQRAMESCRQKTLASVTPQVEAMVQAAQSRRVATNGDVSVTAH
ncbi:MAG: UrcA family protein [Alphaproteobacteria bacterium]|nr:UrcA family protein [Alphaproteobacteria bacterium]